ncbi:MAG: TatD family hydrolase [Candidatus Portnoybacteria bacterium]|jgi:TatD DNase family protein|nr:TatD family hydrolase [Candidatus Portnoybacteria bacterium]
MLIDTHAHVNFAAYKDDGDEVVKRSLAENIWLINVGSQLDTSRRAVEYAQKYPAGVFAAVGLHPIHLREGELQAHVDELEEVRIASRAEKFDHNAYKNLAQNGKVVAIGEIGLDYYRNAAAKYLQKEIFVKQLELALELNKPIIFHCREAHRDLLEILKKYAGKISGVVHSFSGRWSQAQEYLEMGFYLGFNGIITFARDYDRVVRETPLERLVLETDCPYLTPEPFRGKRNEPAYVKYVAQKVAELRGISFEEVAERTTKNAKELFGI